MKHVLHRYNRAYEVRQGTARTKTDQRIPFPDRFSALSFLQGFATDAGALLTFRHLLRAEGLTNLDQCTDQDVLALMADRLASRTLCLTPSTRVRQAGMGGAACGRGGTTSLSSGSSSRSSSGGGSDSSSSPASSGSSASSGDSAVRTDRPPEPARTTQPAPAAFDEPLATGPDDSGPETHANPHGQAEKLKRAAETGTPFVEVCAPDCEPCAATARRQAA